MSDLAQLFEADPERAMMLLRELKKYAIDPHPGQRELIDSEARFKVLNAGRRWGKTKIGANIAVNACRSGDNRLVWWVAPVYKTVKRGYREVLRQLPKDFLLHDPPPDTNFDAGRSVILRFKNGSQMEFYSAERPGGMLGEGVDFAVLDEAATMPANVWEQIVRPTLADKLGSGLLISTPRGRNWFYKRWLYGQDEENKEWASWTFPSESNPYLQASEIEAMKDELPRLTFEQEVLAQFVAAGSSVFRWGQNTIQQNQILANAFVEDEKIEGHQFLGVDLAKTADYTVLYGGSETTRRNTYYERFNSVSWPEQKRRIKRAVFQLRKAGATGVTLIIDSTGLGDPIAEDLEEAGFDVVGINFTTYKAKMVTLLAKDLEQGKAHLLEEGELNEFENYGMKVTAGGRTTYSAPEGEHDDAVSAKMLQHWGIVQEGSPMVTTVSANDPVEAHDPEDIEEDADDWSDLIDDDPFAPMRPEASREPVSASRAPTPEELLNNPNHWG
ncbi:MAG: hypothetical protein H0T60_02520 [Acidobacteria bacterium]|nr:hypothetical protein [Acidobacteriota bacterium]